MDSGTEQPEYW
uniref:Uncharacterized protein n=1 Tax=Leuconostoc citreum TaxID=33964 RepID=A0A098DN24_LEUCI|nr:Protein of unknown function [Leuconostoc citreum]